MTATTAMLDVALAYAAAGRSVVPIAPGSKKPSYFNATTGVVEDLPWKKLQQRPADPGMLQVMFAHSPLGIGIVCGPVSGYQIGGVPHALEVLDVDDAAVLGEFIEAANWQGLSELLHRLLHQRTPGGAGHFAYLCAKWEGNLVLARRPGSPDDPGQPKAVTLIETRGAGGQVVVSPTPPGIHPEHPERGYELVRGAWTDLPIITLDERQALLELARSFNTYVDTPQVRDPKGPQVAGGTRPGDQLNASADRAWWCDLLEAHGWVLVHQRDDIDYWRRPGKEGKAWSATLGACGPYFYVFSSNAAPFDQDRAYNAFSALTLLQHGGDFKAAAKALAPPRQRPAGAPGTPEEAPADPRPVIYLSTDMTRVVDEAEDAIRTMPGAPRVYQRARALTVIAQGVKPPRWLHRPQDLPVMVDVTTTRLMELANQSAQWWRKDKRTKKWEAVLPPGWAIETLRERLAWRFPPLEGIITSPTLRPDGSVLAIPGYDPETGLYLHYNGTAFPPIPPAPTRERALQALKRLKVVIRDFLFAEDCHRSATLAAMLTLVCRFAIMGNTPLFAITANTRGSGKGLLADVISIIGTGRAAPRWPQVSDEEEERKRLLVVALAGYPCLHVDNITRPLGSPALDLALTAPSYSDRILGKTESREVPLNMVWFASGNNLQFQGDMVRRVLPIALDPRMENPETRTGFKHPELVQWVTRWRPRLTVEALTIVKAFYTADCPKPKPALAPWGSFEPWSTLIRQALVWAGEPDPYAGRTHLESESDPAYERLETLLKAWAACYPKHDAHTLAQVNGDIQFHASVPPSAPNAWNALKEALGAMDRKYDGHTLHTHPVGEALKKVKGRTIAGQRLVPGELTHSAREWRIELV